MLHREPSITSSPPGIASVTCTENGVGASAGKRRVGIEGVPSVLTFPMQYGSVIRASAGIVNVGSQCAT